MQHTCNSTQYNDLATVFMANKESVLAKAKPIPAECMLHAACCMLRVACCVLRIACCVLRLVWCMLRVACCVLHAACCVLRAACCVLHAACCMLRGGQVMSIPSADKSWISSTSLLIAGALSLLMMILCQGECSRALTEEHSRDEFTAALRPTAHSP